MVTPAQEIDAIISNADDWRGETLARLRAIVLAAGPDIVEEVKWKKPSRPRGRGRLVVRNGIVCIGEMLKNAVRLTFPEGRPARRTRSRSSPHAWTASSVRAVDFPEGAKLPEAALKALIREAAAQNG